MLESPALANSLLNNADSRQVKPDVVPSTSPSAQGKHPLSHKEELTGADQFANTADEAAATEATTTIGPNKAARGPRKPRTRRRWRGKNRVMRRPPTNEDWYHEDADEFHFEVERQIRVKGAAEMIISVHNDRQSTAGVDAGRTSSPETPTAVAPATEDAAGVDKEAADLETEVAAGNKSALRRRKRQPRQPYLPAPHFRNKFSHGIRVNRMLHQVCSSANKQRPFLELAAYFSPNWRGKQRSYSASSNQQKRRRRRGGDANRTDQQPGDTDAEAVAVDSAGDAGNRPRRRGGWRRGRGNGGGYRQRRNTGNESEREGVANNEGGEVQEHREDIVDKDAGAHHANPATAQSCQSKEAAVPRASASTSAKQESHRSEPPSNGGESASATTGSAPPPAAPDASK